MKKQPAEPYSTLGHPNHFWARSGWHKYWLARQQQLAVHVREEQKIEQAQNGTKGANDEP